MIKTVKTPNGSILSINDNGDIIESSSASTMLKRVGNLPVQLGSRITPDQHGSRITPDQYGSRITPDQHGSRITPDERG